MFSRKKEVKPRASRGSLSKYGLFDIPGMDDAGANDPEDGDDDDSDLEAELLALTSGAPSRTKKPKPPAVPAANLDALVAESLRDIPSDDDISVDENDPNLLGELNDLMSDDDDVHEEAAPSEKQPNTEPKQENYLVTLLQERLQMYQEAEKNAKSVGDAMKARRFNRGIKTLNDMIKQATAGRVVNEEDIPPPVVTSMAKRAPVTPDVSEKDTIATPEGHEEPAPAVVPSRPAPPPPPVPSLPSAPPAVPSPDNESSAPASDPAPAYIAPIGEDETAAAAVPSVDITVQTVLLERRNEYKMAALEAKKAGDTERALQYVRIVKQFEPVLAAAESGLPVDLSTIPPSPLEINITELPGPSAVVARENLERQRGPDNTAQTLGEVAEMIAAAAEAAEGETPVSEESLFNAPPAPTSILEALEQRLEKFRSTEQAAKEEGNSSKMRRLGRIVKQYEQAIKLHKAGKPFPVDELPTPPGFAPIPVPQPAPAAQPEVQPGAPAATPAAPTPAPKPAPRPSVDSPGPTATPPKPNVRKSPQSRQEKQLALLIARQKKFKEAALNAKRKGEVNQAKEYLRLAKGFDPLIEASQNGLPVDLDSLPVPPDGKEELETDFDIVTLNDCLPGSDSEIYEKLEQDLLQQCKSSLATRDHFKAIGDIASANRFEQLALHSKKDLDAVRCAHKRSDPVPKFHYETRTFSLVQCCTDLGDNDLELTIVQGTNYNVSNPKDVDTYVRFEFPYPTEAPVKDRTNLIKDTNNPQYDQSFSLAIQRNVRACQRIFKRQAIKLEVWSRGSIWHRICCFCYNSGSESHNNAESYSGFFRGDTLIGTANVKLTPLETKCMIHDAFDLMEGRRAVGGKLEVKVRIRNPILTKQVEQVQEKWLVIDKYH